MFQDVRLALRQLAAAKGFTLTAILTLALGIGANTGIFTLIHAMMIKSLPVADPQRILRLGDGDNCCVIGGIQGRFGIYSYPLYNHLRDHTPEFEEMAAFQAGIGQSRRPPRRRRPPPTPSSTSSSPAISSPSSDCAPSPAASSRPPTTSAARRPSRS